MEKERLEHEAEEKERAERMKKIKDQFGDPNSQWEKDKTDIQTEALKEKKEKEKVEIIPEAAPAPQAMKEVKVEDVPVIKPEVKPEAKTEVKEEVKPAAKIGTNDPLA